MVQYRLCWTVPYASSPVCAGTCNLLTGSWCKSVMIDAWSLAHTMHLPTTSQTPVQDIFDGPPRKCALCFRSHLKMHRDGDYDWDYDTGHLSMLRWGNSRHCKPYIDTLANKCPFLQYQTHTSTYKQNIQLHIDKLHALMNFPRHKRLRKSCHTWGASQCVYLRRTQPVKRRYKINTSFLSRIQKPLTVSWLNGGHFLLEPLP